MLRKSRSKLGWLGVVALLTALPGPATAHNVGHISLPDGRCLALGSAREAPLVGQDRTQLDLVPSTPLPRDEYGVSFVGFWGNTSIRPGPCPATLVTAADETTGEGGNDEAAGGPFFSLNGE